MSADDIPNRVANGPGNPPDADKLMNNFDWLTAIFLRSAILNGGFEFAWEATSFTNPADGTKILAGWNLRKSGTSAATADVTRESSTIDEGTYSLKVNITGGGSSNSLVALDQVAFSPNRYRGRRLCVGFRIKVATASKVRVKVADGSSTQYSESYHSGSNSWEMVYALITVSASATTITFSVEITSDFTGAIYIDGAFAYVVPTSMLPAALANLRYDTLLEPINQNGLVSVSSDGNKLDRWFLGTDGSWQGVGGI